MLNTSAFVEDGNTPDLGRARGQQMTLNGSSESQWNQLRENVGGNSAKALESRTCGRTSRKSPVNSHSQDLMNS